MALGAKRGDRVLDLACGTGLNFRHLRQLVGKEGHITGVNLTPAMLDVARKLIAKQAWGNVEVLDADAADLPFPDSSFDKAICTFAMNIIPDYARAIAEVERVLVPGGRFVNLELRSLKKSPPSWLQRLSRVCAVDMTHQTLDEIRRVFPSVEVRSYWLGLLFLAVATKKQVAEGERDAQP